MPTHFLQKLPVSFLIIFHNLVTVILLSTAALGEDDNRYTECGGFYDCGLLKNISYPFWAANGRPQQCGLEYYELTCREDQFPVMKIEDQDFLVLNFSRQFYTMTIARSDLWDTPCTDHIVNTTLDHDRFSYVPTVRNLTLLYGCQPGNMSVRNNFTCKVKGTDDDDISYYVDDSSTIRMGNWTSCYLNFRVPIMWEGVDVMPDTPDQLKQVLKQGFQVGYEAEWELCRRCELSNGTCGSKSKSNSNSFVCYCGDGPRDRVCSSSGDNTSWDWKRKVIVGALSAGSGLMICVIVCCIKARKQIFKRSNNQDLEDFIRTNGPLAVKRYKFSEIRKMTQSFKDKLGQGGYGDVYKGNLLDGSPVAVKVLKASKGSGEDFINEVASISRTSHVNVVTLLGYCFEGQKKALVYEFMPNGSLEKYTYNENALQTSIPQLEVEQLLDIVTGIARGLDYLHRGCNTRILHFDIIFFWMKIFAPRFLILGFRNYASTRRVLCRCWMQEGRLGTLLRKCFVETLEEFQLRLMSTAME